MASLSLYRTTTAPPAALWDVVTDFGAYGGWMPLTRMRLDDGEPRVGWGFSGSSGIGPVGFSDSMLLTEWEPPRGGQAGMFRVVKTGRVLGGGVAARVEPDPRGSRLEWHVDVVIRPLPFKRALAPAAVRGTEWLYGRALDAMIRRAEAGSGPA
ncbi:SRPBCC family protein [Pedococcus sp. 5OH_020]|uniref:SRPBCC family protein n=1 Tax=Pedococcus sp. 5OH_020 TaxID=2989814 RepID=UPI0022EA0D00|nr:SRPBCC family protein [Pedococcus sp. 5OH_020]